MRAQSPHAQTSASGHRFSFPHPPNPGMRVACRSARGVRRPRRRGGGSHSPELSEVDDRAVGNVSSESKRYLCVNCPSSNVVLTRKCSVFVKNIIPYTAKLIFAIFTFSVPSFEAFLAPHAYAQLVCSSHTSTRTICSFGWGGRVPRSRTLEPAKWPQQS